MVGTLEVGVGYKQGVGEVDMMVGEGVDMPVGEGVDMPVVEGVDMLEEVVHTLEVCSHPEIEFQHNIKIRSRIRRPLLEVITFSCLLYIFYLNRRSISKNRFVM